MPILRCIVISCLLLPTLAQAQTFSEVSATAGISHKGFCQSQMTGGVVWLDYDQDGDEDLYTTGGLLDNVLYRNNGDGSFSDVTQAAGLVLPQGTHTQGVAAGDIDNDGYRELFVSTWFTQRNYFFKNNGDGTFSDHSQSSGLCLDTLWTSAISFEDFDLDGLVDLYFVNYVYAPTVLFDTSGVTPIAYAHRCDANTLFLNNGDGTFNDVSAAYAIGDTGCGLAAVLSDFDRDNDRDILIANDFGEWVSPNVMYRNEWPAAFQDISSPAGMDGLMYGMGIAAGDYDHDLDPDYYYTDIGGNSFYRNNNDGTFSDVASSNGTLNDSLNHEARTSWGTAFLDYDNDTWLDLFVANGYIQLLQSLNNTHRDPDALYRNLGNGNFQDVSMAEGISDTNASRGMAFADYDNDGDLDFFVNVVSIDTNLEERSKLYRNDVQNGNHYVQFRLEGTVNHRDAFGSKVTIKAGGTQQTTEILSGSSHMSQNSSIAHFGLGAATSLDSTWVTWPDGNVELWVNLAADTTYLIQENPAHFLARTQPSYLRPRLTAFPNPSSGLIHIEFTLPQAQQVQWRILDLKGQVVFSKQEGILTLGKHQRSWEAKDATGNRLAAGLYVLQLQGAKGQSSLRVMITE